MSMMELQGALGGPPGGGPPSITIPGGPAEGGGGGGDSMEFLDAAEEALHQFIQVDPDEVDRSEAAKALQIILKLKASNQQDVEAGGMKSLRKALAGGPPGLG